MTDGRRGCRSAGNFRRSVPHDGVRGIWGLAGLLSYRIVWVPTKWARAVPGGRGLGRALHGKATVSMGPLGFGGSTRSPSFWAGLRRRRWGGHWRSGGRRRTGAGSGPRRRSRRRSRARSQESGREARVVVLQNVVVRFLGPSRVVFR
jgi:hypothetical protein